MNEQNEKIHELEGRIKELEEENNSLSNRVEEMLLFSLINESFESITDERILLQSVLEKISILRDIPYCACYNLSTGECECIVQYCALLNTEPCQGVLNFSDALIEELKHESIIRFSVSDRPDAFHFLNSIDVFQPIEFLALTFHTRSLKQGAFVFISDANPTVSFSNDLQLFHQIIQIVIDKWERLNLLEELQRLNVELEDRVRSRTNDLQQSEEKFRQLFNVANDAIFVWELKNNKIIGCVELNDAVVKMTGFSRKDLATLNPFNLLDDSYTNEERWELEQVFYQPSSIFRATFRARSRMLPLEIHTRRFEVSNRQFIIAIGRDISERQAYEKSIVEARNKAVESERLKTAFLANMSHEIRTPMNAIVGFSELLGQGEMTNGEVKMFADIIFKNSMHLLNLINDIVDYSKIEAKQVKIDSHVINVNELISDLSINMISMLRNMSKNHIDVITHTPLATDSANILTDGTRLRQVISNLINNAIKFTDNGFIEVGYKVKDKWLEFFVRDTGIGIAKENQEKIFERFVQLRTKETVNIGGTGLGLAICSNLVEKMDGQMCIDSSLGKGSTFYFTIPFISAQ